MEGNAIEKRYADELLAAENLDELAAICARIAEEPEEVRQDLEDRNIYTFLPVFGAGTPRHRRCLELGRKSAPGW